MMRKRLILFLLVLIALGSMVYLQMGTKVVAEAKDCDEEEGPQTPTATGEADYSQMNCECNGAIPTIVASSDEIEPGQSITLHVDSGGLACPSYTWVVDDSSYSITSQTDTDLETATLTANSGSCGGEYSDDDIVQ